MTLLMRDQENQKIGEEIERIILSKIEKQQAEQMKMFCLIAFHK